MIAQAATDDSREPDFRRWLKQHIGLVFKVARTFAPSDANRDDLVQEILLQLWRSLPRFNTEVPKDFTEVRKGDPLRASLHASVLLCG
jgi:DNA-directed RNA polymerase specialized sigma24 family protein